MKYEKFPCTQCGCCCRRVGDALKQGIEFPYGAKEDGACEMLENNMCKVYNDRPTVCNIDSVIKLLGQDKQEYYKESIRLCNKMMNEDGISEEYQ